MFCNLNHCFVFVLLFFNHLSPSARIFTDFGLRLLEGRVLHKGAWVATLLGTLLGVQGYKKVKFSVRDILSSAEKGFMYNRVKTAAFNFHVETLFLSV